MTIGSTPTSTGTDAVTGVRRGTPDGSAAHDDATPAVRRGTPGDAAEVLRLRRLIFDAWPFEVDVEAEPGWGERFTATYRELVASPHFAVFVVDDPTPGPRLAACVTVEISRHLPAPGGTGLVAYIADMCTDPAYRGRGLGRLLLETGCAWATEQGAARVELYATEAGRALYESDGFRAEGPFVHMGRRLP